MKRGSYQISLFLGVLCLVLSTVLIVVSYLNQNLQGRLQIQQQALNSGILGQQGQQIAANMMQDMASAAARNPALRTLLEQHGYRLQPPGAAGPSTNVTQTATEGARTSSSTESEPSAESNP